LSGLTDSFSAVISSLTLWCYAAGGRSEETQDVRSRIAADAHQCSKETKIDLTVCTSANHFQNSMMLLALN